MLFLRRKGTAACSRGTTRAHPKRTLIQTRGHATGATASNATTSTTTTKRKLVKVPALPIFGSMIPSYSGTPKLSPDILSWWTAMHRQYGPFYQMGFPGLGVGLFKTMYVISDPTEMMKILKQEGSYPSGIVESQWPIRSWAKDHGFECIQGLYSRGDTWKRYRSFLQKDLLAPQAAREHLPGLLEVATKASRNVPKDSTELGKFLNFCSLDMFTMVLFGGQQKNDVDDEHELLRSAAVEAISGNLKLKRDPVETLMHQIGYVTTKHEHVRKHLDIVFEVGLKRVMDFQQRIETTKTSDNDHLRDNERFSYIAKAMNRKDESDLTAKDVAELCTFMLLAAVETTAGKFSWNLLQLGLNPTVQERLYEELDRAVQQEGTLNANVLGRSSRQMPLLHAFIRETHRVTPTAFINLVKEVRDAPVMLHDELIPPGSVVAFDSYNPGMDPNLVTDPHTFIPDRWFRDASDSRKGTSQEVIDHPFFAAPFSQGARMCPGARIASLEVQVMLARLVLDWKISLSPENITLQDIPTKVETTLLPVWPSIEFVAR